MLPGRKDFYGKGRDRLDLTRYKAIFIVVGIVLGVVLLVALGLPRLVHIKPGLSPQERQLAQYEYKKIEVNERRPATVSGLKNPMLGVVAAGASGKGYPAESLTQLAPPGTPEKDTAGENVPKVSMVVIKDRSRMAIINGEVVREGDRTKRGKVLRITRNGVLIKNGEGEQWLRIE